jgi:hypothetical protein
MIRNLSILCWKNVMNICILMWEVLLIKMFFFYQDCNLNIFEQTANTSELTKKTCENGIANI